MAWHRRPRWGRIGALGAGAIVLALLLLRPVTLQYSHQGTLRAPPHLVWDVVADFSNAYKLDPSLHSFHVVQESGNYDHWRYTVQYRSHGSRAEGRAHVAVRTSGTQHAVAASHRVCYLAGWYCLEWEQELTLRPGGQGVSAGALYTDAVNSSCPWLAAAWCQRQVAACRQDYMRRLATLVEQ